MAVLLGDWLPLANFVVQLLILSALVWYAVETWRIRNLSCEQVEALQKPCLTLMSVPRDYEDAALETDGIVGGMSLKTRDGNLVVQNIGSGPALNVRYEFNPIDPAPGATVARPRGYLQNIPSGEIFVMPVAREVLRNFQYEFLAIYESLNGRRYESRITINNLVLTFLEFRPSATELGGSMPNSESQAHEWWRFFGNLRFTQLAFYGVVAGLLLNAQHDGTSAPLQNRIALAGILVTGVIWLMEISSTHHGIAWKKLASADPPTWLLPPFNASNAALAFYTLAYWYWSSSVTEHLRIVKLGFWALGLWSVFAYFPLWFHSIKQLRKTFRSYGDSFLHK